MKSSATIILLSLLPALAAGVTDPRPDVLAFYFDAGGDDQCRDVVQPFAPFSVYLVYTNPSVADVVGFSAGVHFSGPLLQTGLLPPCSILWLVQPDLDALTIVCPVPLQGAPAVSLLVLEVMATQPSPSAAFWVDAAADQTAWSTPVVLRPDGSAVPVTAGEAAVLLPTCAVTQAQESWGGVKGLYRR